VRPEVRVVPPVEIAARRVRKVASGTSNLDEPGRARAGVSPRAVHVRVPSHAWLMGTEISNMASFANNLSRTVAPALLALGGAACLAAACLADSADDHLTAAQAITPAPADGGLPKCPVDGGAGIFPTPNPYLGYTAYTPYGGGIYGSPYGAPYGSAYGVPGWLGGSDPYYVGGFGLGAYGVGGYGLGAYGFGGYGLPYASGPGYGYLGYPSSYDPYWGYGGWEGYPAPPGQVWLDGGCY
jgi:hypothetical protein